MKRENLKIRLLLGLIVWGTCILILNEIRAEVPQQPSIVYVTGTQLIVEKRLEDNSLDQPKPFIIKGTTWSPATRAPKEGPNPLNLQQTVPYGFFFEYWVNPGDRNPPGHEVLSYWLKNEFLLHYTQDILLLNEMNVNTVRVYADFGEDPGVYNQILDEFYRNGIMVITTIATSKQDIDSQRYLKIVQLYKDHPAILMWSLGNEWNLEYNKYYGYQTVAEAASATELAAQKIKEIDTNHPVSSCLGDRFDDLEFSNTIAGILNVCPNIDVWGINVYRGVSFGDLFTRWQQVTSKPFYISEFGTDSFNTSSYKIVDGYQADNCIGNEDRDRQTSFVLGLWEEIKSHLSALDYAQLCLGGLVHEFNDELWKVGSYHTGLGGLVNYNGPDGLPNTIDDDTSYDEYNTEGFYIPGGHPDNVANEEYFGIVDADRNPKIVFLELKRYYSLLGDNTPPTITNISDSPDPFRLRWGQVSKISYTLGDNLSSGLTVYTYIYTSRGSLVRTLGPRPQNVGQNSVTWDGKNSSGYFVRNGTYKYRLKATDSAENTTYSAYYYVTKRQGRGQERWRE